MAKSFKKLTRPNMRKLISGDKIAEHGIYFERTADGDGVFAINIMVDSQRIHCVVDRESDGTTRTQAEEFVEKLRQDAKHDRLALPTGRKTALGFRDAANKYLTKLEQEGGKDLKQKKQRLELHLIPFFGEKPLSKISSFEVERYKKQRLEEYSNRGRSHHVRGELVHKAATTTTKLTSSGTVNREIAVLSHMFNKALEWKWLNHAPVRLKRLKENSGRIVYLTIKQLTQLKECAETDGHKYIYPFILVSSETSMRASEIFEMRREHVDLDKNVIYIPKAKAGAREQPMTKRLTEYLKGYLDGMPEKAQWLFSSPTSSSGHITDIRKAFRRVVEGAGLDPDVVVRHTMRHTAITHLVQAGVDLPTVKRISGHKTLVMVERYAHANGEHIGAAMDLLEQRYKETGS